MLRQRSQKRQICGERCLPVRLPTFHLQPAILALQIEHLEGGVQCPLQMLFEQPGQLAATGRGPAPGSQVFENLPGVVRTAEKSAVNTLGAALDHGRRAPYQNNPENRAQHHAKVGI